MEILEKQRMRTKKTSERYRMMMMKKSFCLFAFRVSLALYKWKEWTIANATDRAKMHEKKIIKKTDLVLTHLFGELSQSHLDRN